MNRPSPSEFIQRDAELEDFCRNLERAPWLGIDTEFMRERTYFPVFCLLQIATKDRIVCIDPISVGSLEPLVPILLSPRTLTLLHSGRQDLGVLLSALGGLPDPVHDTQIAAGLLGYPEQIGYATLVSELLGIQLDKSHTRTDWSRRPLSIEQIRYAIDDVAYLRPIHEQLLDNLNRLDRLTWFEEECASLLRPDLYRNSIEEAWKKVKGVQDAPEEQFNRLQALAAWREETAQSLNLPRNWILRDEVLCELLKQNARLSPEHLPRIRGISAHRHRQWVERLAQRLEEAEHQPAAAIDSGYCAHHRPELRPVLKDMLAIVQGRARELGIAPSLLSSRRDLEDLVFRPEKSRLGKGWRWRAIGMELQQLLDSRRAT